MSKHGDLLIAYNFWREGDNSSFKVYNETDYNILLISDYGFFVNCMVNTCSRHSVYGESNYII